MSLQTKPAEKDYYPILEKWLIRRELSYINGEKTEKYAAKSNFLLKLKNHNLVEFDVVGGFKHLNRNRFTTFCIELKIDNATEKLFDQIKVRQQYCDHCWIAHSFSDLSNFGYHVINRHDYLLKNGIGVLIVDFETGKVREFLETRISKNKNTLPLFRSKLLLKLGLRQTQLTDFSKKQTIEVNQH